MRKKGSDMGSFIVMNRYLLLLAKFEVKVTEHAYKQVSKMEIGGENARDKIKPRSGACLDH